MLNSNLQALSISTNKITVEITQCFASPPPKALHVNFLI